MSDRTLRDALRAVRPPDADAARERAWRVVDAAHHGIAPRSGGVKRRLLRFAAITTAAAVVGGAAVAAAAPHSGVGTVVRGLLGVNVEPTRHALVHVPGGGRLLVQAGRSTWVVADDGSRRRLGAYDGASWSPRGLFVVAWRGNVLTAVEPSGRPRWSLSRPERNAAARWSPVDGYRIAYVAGATLRVVNGDGTGDRLHGSATPTVAPAWRPDSGHVLAYVDRARRLRVDAVDSRQRLWGTQPLDDPVALAWSPHGTRLLVVERRRVLLYDAAGTRLTAAPVAGATAAAWSPDGRRVALTRFDRRSGDGELLLLDPARDLRARSPLRGPGPFGPPAWSPDGRTVLLPWPAADQWLFLVPRAHRGSTAITGVSRQFSPGAARPPFPRAVTSCCPIGP